MFLVPCPAPSAPCPLSHTRPALYLQVPSELWASLLLASWNVPSRPDSCLGCGHVYQQTHPDHNPRDCPLPSLLPLPTPWMPGAGVAGAGGTPMPRPACALPASVSSLAPHPTFLTLGPVITPPWRGLIHSRFSFHCIHKTLPEHMLRATVALGTRTEERAETPPHQGHQTLSTPIILNCWWPQNPLEAVKPGLPEVLTAGQGWGLTVHLQHGPRCCWCGWLGDRILKNCWSTASCDPERIEARAPGSQDQDKARRQRGQHEQRPGSPGSTQVVSGGGARTRLEGQVEPVMKGPVGGHTPSLWLTKELLCARCP